MIIDALTHVHPIRNAFGEKYNASIEFLVENLEASPVDKAVVTAIAADTHYGTPSEYVAECCQKYPDKIIGIASVHPFKDENPVAKFEKYIAVLGLRGLKLHPRHQQLSVDDPAVAPIVAKAAELGVPVYVCGSQWKHAPLQGQLPMNVDTLAKRVPDAKIVLCHSGGFRFMEGFTVAVANDNVFLETSIALPYFRGTPFEDQYMFTLKKIGAHRVIFGSDHPESPTKDAYEQAAEIFQDHGFSDEERALIFGQNIWELVGEP